MIIVDITERNALEDQLNRDQKMKAIGMMAGGVAVTRESANLNDIIQAYLDSPEFENARSLYPNIHYTMLLSPEIDNIPCSITHIKKSLMTLVTNASEAREETGQVTIATSNTIVDTLIPTWTRNNYSRTLCHGVSQGLRKRYNTSRVDSYF